MSEPSGAQWCARFPTSQSIADLEQGFGLKVQAFVNALRQVGQVRVNATFRPPERAYLMHWACLIAKSGQDPAAVPPMAGVDIDWTCGGNLPAARAAAAAMVAGYDIAFPAALVSRHTQRLAIDMGVAIPAGAEVVDGDGVINEFATGADGQDPRVIEIGKTFDVIKYAYQPPDPPHWSSDGH